MTKQDERMRQQKRLVERAIEQAAANQWQAAVETNLRLIEFGADAEAYNRLGKAYLELGQYDQALEAYNNALQLSPANVIARRNIARIEQLRGLDYSGARERRYADPQVFIVDSGKTALTTLTHLAPAGVVLALEIGEELEIDIEEQEVFLRDSTGARVGQLEPLLARRLIELIERGNRYAAVVASVEPGTVKVLIREVYQDPEQRHLVSFPGRLGGDIAHFRTYRGEGAARFDLEVDELQEEEEEELLEEELVEEGEDDFFRGGSEEEEVGLEALESEISTDEEEEEV
ncbi:tetratricopeptide repeat protein [Kallotenue papyrolyticum]|uniref:tetratricopeptide repeat protein n=1 Tax=Kallotenue papyrolyticum TaxID=1325125 RepID=UPI0023EBC783|nr:tetratricopeptide repeat protein [Kallotenue papyrolyticum]